MTDEKDAAAAVPPGRQLAGSVQITLNLSDKRGLQVSMYLYSDDTKTEINQRIDQMQDVLDRQAIRADLVTKRAQIEGLRLNLVHLKDGYEKLADKVGGRTKTSMEKTQIAEYPKQVQQAKAMIESLQAAIAAGEAKLNEE